MIILGIETSCDETAVAVVKFEKSYPKILSNIISSQVKIHKKWGGVVPSLAKREHQRNLVPVLKKALLESGLLTPKLKNKKSKIQVKNQRLKEILEKEEYLCKKLIKFFADYKKPKINIIAVTIGIGLEPALWVGVNFTRALSYFWDLPLIPVSHIEGHIFANFLGKKFDTKDKSLFPALCLSVSGGHTQLILIKDYGKYTLVGETRDDTAGECFDKVARMLGLGYPGGPQIARLAKGGDSDAFSFPRPMKYTKDYDFSFSGLKTAVLYFLKKLSKEEIEKRKKDIAASFQQAIIDVLITKAARAVKEFHAKTVFLAGGVAANEELRIQLQERIQKGIPNTKYNIPNTKLCTDNGAMVAMAAFFHSLRKETRKWQEIKADANLKL